MMLKTRPVDIQILALPFYIRIIKGVFSKARRFILSLKNREGLAPTLGFS